MALTREIRSWKGFEYALKEEDGIIISQAARDLSLLI
jgi:hypothetical protein